MSAEQYNVYECGYRLENKTRGPRGERAVGQWRTEEHRRPERRKEAGAWWGTRNMSGKFFPSCNSFLPHPHTIAHASCPHFIQTMAYLPHSRLCTPVKTEQSKTETRWNNMNLSTFCVNLRSLYKQLNKFLFRGFKLESQSIKFQFK